MKSIKLPGFNIEIGKGQEDIYNVLNAMSIPGPEGEVVVCFELTDEEVEKIIKTKRIFYHQLTFFQKFSPMRIATELEGLAASQHDAFCKMPVDLPGVNDEHTII